MPLTAPQRQSPGSGNGISRMGLFLLLLAMSIGLGIWLYSSLRKKEMYRQQTEPVEFDSITGSR